MSFPFMLAATSLLLVALFVTSARDAQQANAENYIKQSESEWAAAASKGDTGTVKRILADDFLGIAPDGSFYDKAKEIADTMNDHGNTISNHVNEVKIRFFGETAVAQGSETWERKLLRRRPVASRIRQEIELYPLENLEQHGASLNGFTSETNRRRCLTSRGSGWD